MWISLMRSLVKAVSGRPPGSPFLREIDDRWPKDLALAHNPITRRMGF
jgi:hypothetical protein